MDLFLYDGENPGFWGVFKTILNIRNGAFLRK